MQFFIFKKNLRKKILDFKKFFFFITIHKIKNDL